MAGRAIGGPPQAEHVRARGRLAGPAGAFGGAAGGTAACGEPAGSMARVRLGSPSPNTMVASITFTSPPAIIVPSAFRPPPSAFPDAAGCRVYKKTRRRR